MDIQRLRNLTTNRLHTEIDHIHEDIGTLTRVHVTMPHLIPRTIRAMEPWLRRVLPDSSFWNNELDRGHTGHIDVPTMTDEEQSAMLARYHEQREDNP